RLVAQRAKLYYQRRIATGALAYPEAAGRRSKDRDVRFPVTIEIRRCRNVLRQAPVGTAVRAVTASVDKEHAAARPVDRDIRFTIAIIVSRRELIARNPEVLRIRTITRAVNIPVTVRRTVNRH